MPRRKYVLHAFRSSLSIPLRPLCRFVLVHGQHNTNRVLMFAVSRCTRNFESAGLCCSFGSLHVNNVLLDPDSNIKPRNKMSMVIIAAENVEDALTPGGPYLQTSAVLL